MKKKQLNVCLKITIFLLISIFPSEPIYAQSERIKNGGFETGSLHPWIYIIGLGSIPTPPSVVTDTVAYNGQYSLYFGGQTPRSVKQDFCCFKKIYFSKYCKFHNYKRFFSSLSIYFSN